MGYLKRHRLNAKDYRTDGDIVKLARTWRGLQDRIFELRDAIRLSDHPNAAQIAEALDNSCTFYDSPEVVVLEYLEHPEQWQEDGYWGIEHVGAKRAAEARDR